MKTYHYLTAIGASAVLAFGVAACGDDEESSSSTTGENLSGQIQTDGSSTVAPFAEAAAELFQADNPDVKITVGTSGTGGGFEKFCRGETDISDASRPIKDEEIELCKENGIAYEQLGVANDGLSIAVNPENDWAKCMTVEELSKAWTRGSKVDNWNQINPDYPDEKLELFGPGSDSGTFDYFTEAVNGEEGVIRTDYNNIGEDDNAAVTGVAGSKGGMAFIPLSFVEQNSDKIKAIEIENDKGDCVAPSTETVQDGTYNPLGRQLFMYPSAEAAQRPEVDAFLKFAIDNNEKIAEQALFIPLNDEQKEAANAKIEEIIAAAEGSGSETTATTE